MANPPNGDKKSRHHPGHPNASSAQRKTLAAIRKTGPSSAKTAQKTNSKQKEQQQPKATNQSMSTHAMNIKHDNIIRG